MKRCSRWPFLTLDALRRAFFLIGVLVATPRASAQDVRFATGLAFLDPGAYLGIPLAAPLFSGVLPERVDLAPFAPVGDQGNQGSCVGWATAYAMKTYQENAERKWGVATKEHQFSPAFIYNQIRLGPTCEGGTYYTDALNLLTRYGAATLSMFPYDAARCSALPTPLVKQSAEAFRIASWRRVNTADETEVKTHLAGGFPVLVGMPVDQAFMNLRGEGIYQGLSGPILGGHAMAVTGYDDSKGAFEVLNSWGTAWGHRGRGWLSYAGFRQTVREGYVTQDIVGSPVGNPEPAPVTLEFETIVYAETPLGIKSTETTTRDHHCETNCQGEPTRTNYKLLLSGDENTLFKNPKLSCSSGPCEGWNAVLAVRLEDGGRTATASWDVWAHPTTWALTAGQYRKAEVSRFVRRVVLGTSFAVLGETGGIPPTVTGRLSTGETSSFVVGRPTLNRYIRLANVQVQGPETVYTYETTVP